MSFRAAVLAAFTALLLVPGTALAARTVAPQPTLDISKLPWEPVGFFKPGQPISPTTDPPKFTAGNIFNPSGHWSAYDTNVFESLNFPTRQPTTSPPPTRQATAACPTASARKAPTRSSSAPGAAPTTSSSTSTTSSAR